MGDDQAFIEAAQREVLDQLRARREAGKYDTIVAVIQSPTGELYRGTTFETSQPQFDFCAERHALHNMFTADPTITSFDRLFVAGAVPEPSDPVTTPCGACRSALHDVNPDATVFCSHFVREPDGWNEFPNVERFSVAELLPNAYDPPSWD